MRTYYTSPANDWNKALPIGNGRLGAMIFGGVTSEHIQFNEDSVWYGGPQKRINPDALPNLEKIRQLIFAGRIREAEQLTVRAFTSLPETMRPYQTLCDAYISIQHAGGGEPTDYMRTLDIDNAVAVVSYKIAGIQYRREIIASSPDGVIAMLFTGDAPFSFEMRIDRGRYYDACGSTDGMIWLSGATGGGGVSFAAAVSARAIGGGEVYTIGEYLIAKDVKQLLVVFDGETTYRESEPLKAAGEKIRSALEKGWQRILEDHVADYKSLYDRAQLKLLTDDERKKYESYPTDKLLSDVREGASAEAFRAASELYFAFGRYLLISCSRPGTLAATLQGIWNREFTPSWDSKYTININTEMNYWPAECCNLAECAEPLFDLVERIAENGRETAREMYGCGGFVTHHNTDMWGDTAPQDRYIPGTYWVMGGAWLALHMWYRYEYNPSDLDFLRRAYPTLKSAAEFFVDFLVEHNGMLVTCPSVSPENTYILPSGERGCLCWGATMDSMIIYDLFTAVAESAKILGIDGDFAAKITEMREKLPKPSIGKHGQIMEWPEDYDEAEPGHRHISHLYGLYPSWQLGKEPLLSAARVTLERRLAHGGGHTGWSRAWIICMWARLRDAENVSENIRLLLGKSTYDNLFDSHPPFQIDGNFGGIAGIAEALLQSQGETYDILPALPPEWKDGEVRGLRARGGAEIDIEWREGVPVSVKVRGGDGRPVTFHGKPLDAEVLT